MLAKYALKKMVFFIAILFLSLASFAQKNFNTYFIKKNGTQTKFRDSAAFIRLIEEPDNGSQLFVLKEHYKESGILKTSGYLSSFTPALVYEGTVSRYDEKGVKVASQNFENGKLSGSSFIYFTNGEVESQHDFVAKTSIPNETKKGEKPNDNQLIMKLIYQADSTGKVLVKDGAGFGTNMLIIGKDTLIEQGKYKGGLKDSLWVAKNRTGTIVTNEIYNGGDFVSGERIVDGKKTAYNVRESRPEFKGGMTAFYQYLSRNIKYPKDAIDNKIQGTVHLKFVINKDGSVTDVKVTKSVYPSIDEEAVRIIEDSPKWIPGIQYGMPVRVLYNVPIKFNANFR